MNETTNETPDEMTLMTQRARMEWDERLGSTVASARHWRKACFGAIGIALLAVAGITWIGGQSKIQPYALALHDNEVLPMPSMRQLSETKLNQLYQQDIRDFVESSRTVVMDVAAQKTLVTHAYRYLRPNTPAHTQLTAKFKKESPFERAERELVKVQVTSVLPIAEHSFQVEWTETSSDRTGKAFPSKKFKASVYDEVIPPTTAAAINANPLGFYITTFNDVEIR